MGAGPSSTGGVLAEADGRRVHSDRGGGGDGGDGGG